MSTPGQYGIGDWVEVNENLADGAGVPDQDAGRGGTVIGNRYNQRVKDWTSDVLFEDGSREFRNRDLTNSNGNGPWRGYDDIERLPAVPHTPLR